MSQPSDVVNRAVEVIRASEAVRARVDRHRAQPSTESDFAPFIAAHMATIRAADLPPLGKAMIDAVAFIWRRLGNLFGNL
jgi:hypothetical protein